MWVGRECSVFLVFGDGKKEVVYWKVDHETYIEVFDRNVPCNLSLLASFLFLSASM